MSRRLLLLLVLAGCQGAVARAPGMKGAGPRPGDWTIEVSGPAAASIRYRDTEVASFVYPFWGKDWSWVGVDVKPAPATGENRGFEIAIADLGLTLRGNVHAGTGELVFDYTIEAARKIDGVVGGGLEFNLKLGSPALVGAAPEVELLDDHRGFTWSPYPGQAVAVALDQPIPSVAFERGNRDKIRFYLVAGHVEPGRTTRKLTIRLPAGGTVRRSLADRYGAESGPSWVPDLLPWDKWPVDVSFLNDGDRPAGQHGRVRARGDQLEFEDGTPARFWGTNVAAYTLFGSDHAAVALQARRIAALGYNLVRLHHHDSDWVSPNLIAAGDTTQALNPAALDDLDWWVKCLRDAGVYVWVDLKVGRVFRAGDAIPGFDELTRSEKTGRGFDYVNPRLEALERELAARYLTHVNRYTGKAYVDDPAIVAALLMNEDDLTAHFGNVMLPGNGNRVHERMIRDLVGQSAAALHVSASDAMRFWQPGPAKRVLADIEANLFRRQTAALREAGFRGLVAGTSTWGSEPISSLPSLASTDIVDAHAYGDAEALSVNPRLAPNFITWIGAAQVAGKPLSVSEWNVPIPARDRFTAPLYVAAIASLQGWDAPMIFAYLQDGLAGPPSGAGDWSTGYDPALTALMPAAAVLFRRQHVAPARTTYRFAPGPALYDRDISPKESATIRTLVEQSRLVLVPPALPGAAWSNPAPAGAGGSGGTVEVTDVDRDFIPAGQDRVRSDTGELERDWVAGTETIDTPLSQAAAGWIGGRRIALHDVEIAVDAPKATVALTSLDGAPLSRSKKMLLTVVGQVATGENRQLPFRSQPVTGSLSLRSSVASLAMTPLSATASGWRPLAPSRRDGRSVFSFPVRGVPFTHWYLIQPAAPARNAP